MVDTNSNPKDVEFLIPSNDDASKSIELIVGHMCDSIKEGLAERKASKQKVEAENLKAQEKKEAKEAEEAKVAEVETEGAKAETVDKK